MIVFFDLPVKTKTQRKTATRFRNFLLKDGYFMVNFLFVAGYATDTMTLKNIKYA
ncbi:MAG: CRISPR-associated endonuclease Cas2 [Clostridiales bacterium]|nr:CRISPR-associated endonuclease Cas2 [Clostridiales bacterium]